MRKFIENSVFINPCKVKNLESAKVYEGMSKILKNRSICGIDFIMAIVQVPRIGVVFVPPELQHLVVTQFPIPEYLYTVLQLYRYFFVLPTPFFYARHTTV